MFTRIDFSQRAEDSRANRVYEYAVTATPNGKRGDESLFIDGPREAGWQILEACEDIDIQFAVARYGEPFPDGNERFRLRLDFPGLVAPRALEVLDALADVLILRVDEEDVLDHAITLDWYKQAEDGVDPMQWSNTTAGDLVWRGKYWNDDRVNRAAGSELTRLLMEVAVVHPLIRESTAVASPPSSRKSKYFGSRLGRTVADRLNLPFLVVSDLDSGNAPSKSRQTGEIRLVEHRYVCSEACEGRVLVVDDVFRSGASMRSVARAVRAQGAGTVFGIAGAKTMRN